MATTNQPFRYDVAPDVAKVAGSKTSTFFACPKKVENTGPRAKPNKYKSPAHKAREANRKAEFLKRKFG